MFGRSSVGITSELLLRRSVSSIRSINQHNSPAAAVPLIEHYRPRWPQPPLAAAPTGNKTELNGIVPVLNIPKTRSVPASALRFSLSATFSHGSSIYYSHLQYHPTDFKVALKVFVRDLGLTKDEEAIFLEMVGKRYNQGRKEVKLTADRFPNRIENKRYLVVLLENLVIEAKELCLQASQYNAYDVKDVQSEASYAKKKSPFH